MTDEWVADEWAIGFTACRHPDASGDHRTKPGISGVPWGEAPHTLNRTVSITGMKLIVILVRFTGIAAKVL